MCGIFGIIGKEHNQYSGECLDSIKHRGPDDEGFFEDNNVILGFRRLSIIDLSKRGHQPMTNEDGTVWIVFNGEIYNHKEIKAELTGHKFKSASDTEVLIHGFEEWGIEKLLKKINGMFAFCIYDKKKNKAFVARDRIGKKPLYLYKSKNFISFSSETKAFFKLSDFKFEINEELLHLWMSFPYLPDNESTLIKNVSKLPPSHYIEISNNGECKPKQYWTLPYEAKDGGVDNDIHVLENLLVDSVKRRMEADVPVGILLSGGLDSSLISAIASRNSNQKVKTINISFPGSGIDESYYASAVAKHCHTDHTSLRLDYKDIYNQLKDAISIYDDLGTTDSGLFSTFLLSKKIRDLGIRVILVGEGADEVFGGYSWFQLGQIPLRFIPENLKFYLYNFAVMRQLQGRSVVRGWKYTEEIMNSYPGDIFSKIQAFEILHSLPNHYCMKVDKGSSAGSIEARAPFLDYRIVELSRKVDRKFFFRSPFLNMKEPIEKHALRVIAEKYLPQQIYKRKKRGGMFPVNKILEDGIKQDSQLVLNNPVINNLFKIDNIKSLLDNKPSVNIYEWQREWMLWKILMFSLWFNHFSKE